MQPDTNTGGAPPRTPELAVPAPGALAISGAGTATFLR